jgi:hypothetical protein
VELVVAEPGHASVFDAETATAVTGRRSQRATRMGKWTVGAE